MTELVELPLAAPRALRAAVDFLARMPEIERSVSRGAERVQSVLDEVLERVRPVQGDLEDLRDAGETLERRLAASTRELERLSGVATQLTEVSARLEGAIEHLLDRVPGFSSEKAVDRAEEVMQETSGGRDGTRT